MYGQDEYEKVSLNSQRDRKKSNWYQIGCSNYNAQTGEEKQQIHHHHHD